MSALAFHSEPACLTTLRQQYRELVAARPDRAWELQRVLEDATIALRHAAAGRYDPPLLFTPAQLAERRAEEPPTHVQVVALSYEEAPWSRPDIIDLRFDRRCHQTHGRGYWRDFDSNTCPKAFKHLPWSVYMRIPPVPLWTPETVAQVLAIARAELVARGAQGACRVAVKLLAESDYHVCAVKVHVRVGDLRARFSIETATPFRRPLPPAVLETLHARASTVADDLRRAVDHVRKLDAAAKSAGA